MNSTRIVFCSLVLAFAGSVRAQEDPYLEDVRTGERQLERGRMARARAIFEGVLDALEDTRGTPDAPSDDAVRASRAGLFRIDLRGGEYDVVAKQIDALAASERERPEFQWLRAEAAMRRGDFERAERVLRAMLEGGDAFAASCRLGEVLAETGRHEDAAAVWTAAIDRSRRTPVREPASLTWLAKIHIDLGGRTNLEQASALLVEAIRLAPERAQAHILYGELRFLVYGEWSGARSGEIQLKKVLENNGEVEEALLALFRIRKTNHLLDPAKTDAFLQRALAANPNSVPAMLERAITLIDDRRFEEGARLLDRALEINPNDKRVLAQRAAVAHLQGQFEKATEYRDAALAIDERFGFVDVALGDRLVALYRFGDAVPFYRAALERQPESVPALHGLAKALVYSGKGEESVELLRLAEAQQPGFVNPWRNNVLAVQELLDDEYDTVDSDGFVFRFHREDREVLAAYLMPYHLEARRVLGEKYGYSFGDQVRVEVFKTWDDFSVRTIGFRGFTALGACFGPLITLVSPGDNDLRRNDFMWSATVWHEYAHVLTLGLSKHRVPRWLTEGISVHEEGARNKAWERGMERDLLDAFHNGEVPPVVLMNRMFRGPRILFGYYLGGLIVDLVSRDFGFDKVVAMLRLYAEDKSTETIFEEALGLSTREFDARFREFIADKIRPLRIVPRYSERTMSRLLAAVQKDPADVEAHLQLAWSLLARDVTVDAAQHLRIALEADPENAEAQLVYAEILRRGNSLEEALKAYAKGFAGGADDFDSRVRYGALLADGGDVDGAARQFLAAKRCWPSCTDQAVAPELLLARLYGKAERETEAMMELQAFCKKTARAFQPRLDLAEYARAAGDRRQEIELLEQAIQIDPFMREIHDLLATAYLAVGRKEDAVRELQMTLAVEPDVDRAYLGMPVAEVPKIDDPAYQESQASVCVRLARVLHELGQASRARRYLERARTLSPRGDAGSEAGELLERWGR